MGYSKVKFHSDKQSAAHCDKRAVFVRSARRFWAAPGRDSAHSAVWTTSRSIPGTAWWSQAYIVGLRLSDGGEYAG